MLTISRLVILSWTITQYILVSGEEMTKNLTLGPLVGLREEILGSHVDIYLGIPYAKPPVGMRRFKNPEPYGSWDQVLNSTEYKPACPQAFRNEWVWQELSGFSDYSEDCLHLNVFAPIPKQENETILSPVLVFIHGGGWDKGTAGIHDGRTLAATQGIVVVTFNYRLGVLGFLSTEDASAMGNIGLYDQNLVLKWVKKHIQEFGGDPSEVTLGGHEVGGEAVFIHMVSPMSKNLFHKALPMSGVAPFKYDAWNNLEQEPKKWAQELGKKVKCKETDSARLIVCLRKLSYESLAMASLKPLSARIPIWQPHQDGKLIPKTIEALWKKKDNHRIPILYGAAYFPDIHGEAYVNETELTKEAFLKIIKEFSQISLGDGAWGKALSDLLLYEYSDWNDPENRVMMKRNIEKMYHDIAWASAHKAFKTYVHNSTNRPKNTEANLKVYFFKYQSEKDSEGKWEGEPVDLNMKYAFGEPISTHKQNGMDYTTKDKEISQTLLNHWGNYVRTGDPNPLAEENSWPKFTMEDQKYNVIDAGESIGQHYNKKAVAFWGTYKDKILASAKMAESKMTTTAMPEPEPEPEGPEEGYFLATWILLGIIVVLFVMLIIILYRASQRKAKDYEMKDIKYVAR